MMKTVLISLVGIALLFGCVPEKQAIETKDIVMYANLKNEAEAIKQYEYYHSKEGVWPEVVNAAKVSGMKALKIYRFKNQLVMIITIPVNADMEEIGKKYAESSKKLSEWDEFMISNFFESVMENGEEKTWVEMKNVYHFEGGSIVD